MKQQDAVSVPPARGRGSVSEAAWQRDGRWLTIRSPGGAVKLDKVE